MSDPRTGISVLIRTRTETDEVFRLISALARQNRRPDEIVVIDSGSAGWVKDRLHRFAMDGVPNGRERPIPLILDEIPPETYRSADALNTGIARTSQPLVAVISQDALPANEHYLERLAEALDDARVAGAYARQVLNGHYCPIGEKDLTRTYPPRPRTQHAPDCWFVNTCSLIRRELWEQHPFEVRAVISEDHEWAKWVQARGFVVQYQPEALVYHFHPFRGYRELWSRFYQEGLGLAYVHGRRPGPLCCLVGYLREVASDAWWLLRRGKPWFWPVAVLRRTVKHLALFRGYWSAPRPEPATGAVARHLPQGAK